MSKIPEPPSISNLALGGVVALFVVTIGVLGGLFYNLRAGRAAALAKTAPLVQVRAAENSAALPPEIARQNTPAEDDAPIIRVALKTDDAPPVVEPQLKIETPQAPEREATKTEEQVGFLPASPSSAAPIKEGSNELVPEITGLSYTAKKALSNGGDATGMVKPGDNKPGKKPEPKKPIPAVPIVPPKTPAKPEPPKTTPPKTDPAKPPALPPLDPTKMDFSKAPVYVLNDGRRIRALAVRENGTNITVKNEAGTDITFKKSDVKEILRS